MAATDMAWLAETPLFARLDDVERGALADLLVAKSYTGGQTVFRHGDPGDGLYLIRRGRVQALLENDIGETLVLAEIRAGEIFGEMSLYDGGPHSATVVAAEPSEVLVLGREVFLQFLVKHPSAALDLMAVMSRRLRGADDVLRGCVTRNPNVEETDRLTLGEYLADRVASFGGSWTFILLFGSILVGWVALNAFLLFHRSFDPFDPYPFILLNLVLSTLAALQAPVIMMSQNRQSVKDRLKADLDYQINLKAELEIASCTGRWTGSRRRSRAISPEACPGPRAMVPRSRLNRARSVRTRVE